MISRVYGSGRQLGQLAVDRGHGLRHSYNMAGHDASLGSTLRVLTAHRSIQTAPGSGLCKAHAAAPNTPLRLAHGQGYEHGETAQKVGHVHLSNLIVSIIK